ncbi:MAG: hypothetical protein CVV64_17760 [Candidatus Wallbacteria bacterium HGW-Wallbacteria-1]|jgi:uncharacterized protein (DUF2147 family)|uniref:Uncharacterized protein n=1 Tax=Candidatus Wallbacteria bacterium HGW-Wallbacteria-1 TaxID=2013854 RepID=A0A2N1PK48_9BACT|nr:MAG: hypothetical protein CVV64_17760 [Candidatus Wallbacteria bacterium HGW-Wallbacteria-1]
MKKVIYLFAVLLLTMNFIASALAADPAGTWMSSSGSTVKIWANMQQLVITIITPQGQSFKYQGWWTKFGEMFAYQVPGTGTHTGIFYAGNSNRIQIQAPNGGRYEWTRWTGANTQPATPAPQPQNGYNDASSFNNMINRNRAANNGYSTTVPTAPPPPPAYNPNQNNPMHGSFYTKQAYNQSRQPAPPAVNINGLWNSSSGSSIQLASQGNQVFVTVVGSNGQRYQGSGRWLVAGSQFDYSIPGLNGVAVCTINPQNYNQITVLMNGRYTYWSR